MAAPVIVKVLSTLGLILVVNRLAKNLMIAAAMGAVALGAWCGHGVEGIFFIAWSRLSSADNLMLMLVIVEVLSLSTQMARSGATNDLVHAVQSKVSRRTSLAVIPAVIGLLPMPGGAAFSAPLVDDIDSKNELHPMLKTRINYWFRHIWEYWWPIYPGVALALTITDLQPWQIMVLHLPLSAGAVLVGYIFLLRKVEDSDDAGPTKDSENPKSILLILLPIFVVIAAYTLVYLMRSIPHFPIQHKFFPMAVGIICAMIVLQYQRPLNREMWKIVVFNKRSFHLAVLVAIIVVYGAFIDADLPDGTALVEKMSTELNEFGIPIMLVIIAIPFVAGIATGITVAYVGAGFPIVLSLIGKDPDRAVFLSTIVLAYGSGFVGMMLSPVHVCLVVTNEHFKTQLADSILRLSATAFGMLLLVVIYHFIIRWIF